VQFKDVIGQDQLKERLIQGVRENRLAHAQLFLGPSGRGGLALALAFAQYINCESPQPDDSCGNCPSCKKAQGFIHPDIHYSYPIVTVLSGPKAKQKRQATDYLPLWRQMLSEDVYSSYSGWMDRIVAELGGSPNKQGNIPKEECMDIIRKLNLKSFESQHKVLVMWLPEYLGNDGNRLLKLIEEPPAGTVFLFVAENKERILNTILSRVQISSLSPLSENLIEIRLQEHYAVAPGRAKQIAVLAEGDWSRAVELSERQDEEDQSLFYEWLDYCLQWQLLSLNNWIEDFAKKPREKQKDFFVIASRFCRHAMLEDVMPSSQSEPMVQKMAQVMPASSWMQCSEKLDKSAYYLERYANPRMLMMDLSIFFSRLIMENKMAQSGAKVSR
jgi:DNA polymerase-3 subunit delta'